MLLILFQAVYCQLIPEFQRYGKFHLCCFSCWCGHITIIEYNCITLFPANFRDQLKNTEKIESAVEPMLVEAIILWIDFGGAVDY